MATPEESSNTGWSEFFTRVTSFIVICGRQYGVANENFTEYAIEHISMLLQGITHIVDVIDQANIPTLRQFKSNAEDLRDLLNVMLN